MSLLNGKILVNKLNEIIIGAGRIIVKNIFENLTVVGLGKIIK